MQMVTCRWLLLNFTQQGSEGTRMKEWRKHVKDQVWVCGGGRTRVCACVCVFLIFIETIVKLGTAAPDSCQTAYTQPTPFNTRCVEHTLHFSLNVVFILISVSVKGFTLVAGGWAEIWEGYYGFLHRHDCGDCVYEKFCVNKVLLIAWLIHRGTEQLYVSRWIGGNFISHDQWIAVLIFQMFCLNFGALWETDWTLGI